MRKSNIWMMAICMVLICGTAGCSAEKLGRELIKEVTPTPVPEATATPSPLPTPTPVPVSTATPAPWRIGNKTALSSFVYLSNHLNDKIRELYLMSSDGYEWGKNLIPAESTIKAFEKVQLCYTPVSAEDGSEITRYSMKFVTQSGKVYQLDQVPLPDMQQAILKVDQDVISLHYTSLSEKTEKVLSGSDADLGYSDWKDSGQDSDYEYDYDTDDYYDYDSDYDQYYYENDDSEDYGTQYDDHSYYDESYETEEYSYDDGEYN